MTAERIAAVITCHNLGRFLGDALESVERQTRPASEIVVVDDASTDLYTRQRLARIQRDGTRVVRASGLGASGARNFGARLTSAEYLVWLDADDTLEPRYFEAAAAPLDADSALDFVTCAKRAFGAASYVWTPSLPTFVDAISTGGVPHASTMLRRGLWSAIGGFDEGLRSFELLDFWATAFEHGARGTVLAEPFLNYRVRAGSAYRRSIQPSVYLDRLRHVYAKHHGATERHGFDLIQGKEAFLLSQRAHRQMLESRTAALEAELGQLKVAIAEAARLLESRGTPRVSWGDLTRVEPLSRHAGRDRGTPIERHYIERFLDRHQSDVRGRVLEVAESAYARRYGGDAVTASDVIDDFINPGTIPSTYDTIILTQTGALAGDMPAALSECARILRPGGVLLAAVPCIVRTDEASRDRDRWRLTDASARMLFADAFPIDAFEVTTYGNVKACTAFLHGLSVEEMALADLDYTDPAFPLVIAIRATKPTQATAMKPLDVHAPGPAVTVGATCLGAIISYHRIADLSPDSHALCTPPDVFRAHMTILRDHFAPIALDDLVQAAASGSIPERAVAVTLDDGYVDAMTTASPILLELGIPATFFVNSDRLDEEHERWWDVLERVFLCQPALPPALHLQIGGRDLWAHTSNARERASALDSVNRAAWPLDGPARRRLVSDVLAWSGAVTCARATHRVLTGDEIRALAARPGHVVGAHTTNHLALTTHAAEVKRREIADDKAALERLLGRPLHLFAYPYGEYDAETAAAVRDAGFRAAVTVNAGLVSAGGNRLLLPRVEVTQRYRDRFDLRMREIFG